MDGGDGKALLGCAEEWVWNPQDLSLPDRRCEVVSENRWRGFTGYCSQMPSGPCFSHQIFSFFFFMFIKIFLDLLLDFFKISFDACQVESF